MQNYYAYLDASLVRMSRMDFRPHSTHRGRRTEEKSEKQLLFGFELFGLVLLVNLLSDHQGFDRAELEKQNTLVCSKKVQSRRRRDQSKSLR